MSSPLKKLADGEAVIAIFADTTIAGVECQRFSRYEDLFVQGAVPVDFVVGPYHPPGSALTMAEAMFKARRLASHRAMLFMLIATSPEDHTIPVLFREGLLGYEDSSEAQSLVDRLKQTILECRLRELHVASHYLRRFLRHNKFYRDLTELEVSLLCHPHKEEGQILRVAEAFFLDQKVKQGQETLLYVPLDSVELFRTQAIELYEQFVALRKQDATVTSYKGGIVIIDSDYNAVSKLRAILTEMEYRNVNGFATVVDAIHYLERNPNVKLIFTEWHLKDAPAGGFFDAMESAKLPFPPIVLHSNRFAGNPDFLESEFGVEAILPKDGLPSVKTKAVIRKVLTRISDLSIPSSLKREIKRCLWEDDLYTAKNFLHRYIRSNETSVVSKEILIATFDYHTRELKQARDRLLRCLSEQYPHQVSKKEWFEIVDLLAMVYYELTDFPAALKYMIKAYQIAPLSIRRMCLLAELYGAIGDLTKANEMIAKALNISKHSIRIKKTALMLKIIDPKRNIIEINQELHDMNIHEDVYQQLNQVAIKKIKNALSASPQGQGSNVHNSTMFASAIEFYQMCLSSIPEPKTIMRATVNYNLTLAYCRINDRLKALRQAEITLELIKGIEETSLTRIVIRKIVQIHEKLSKLAPGEAIVLDSYEQKMELIKSAMNPAKPAPVSDDFLAANQLRLSLEETRGLYKTFRPTGLSRSSMALIKILDAVETNEESDQKAG